MKVSYTYTPQFKVYFYDLLNLQSFGGQYEHYTNAQFVARTMLTSERKSAFKIVRISDGVVLAQSKAAQS